MTTANFLTPCPPEAAERGLLEHNHILFLQEPVRNSPNRGVGARKTELVPVAGQARQHGAVSVIPCHQTQNAFEFINISSAVVETK